MLRKIAIAATTALTFFIAELVALPLGNPLDASWLTTGIFWAGADDEEGDDDCGTCVPLCESWNLRVGYYGDFVFNRLMQVDLHDNDSRIRRTEIFTNAGFIAVNFWDRFDVFATLGASRARVRTPSSSFIVTPAVEATLNNVINIEMQSHFSWSVGLRATLWECGSLGLGAETQFFSYNGKINYVDFAYTTPIYLTGAKTRFWEYQFGLGVTYTIPITGCDTTFVVPYVGIKWAHARIDFGKFFITDFSGSTYRLYTIESQHTTGFAVGVTLVGAERWSITGEARFIDEWAAHINTQLRF